MKTLALAMLVVASTLTIVAVADSVNFDNAPVGQAPAGWTATKTGSGNAKWTIEKDDTAPSKPNVLKQSGVATFPLCFKDDTNLKDGFVEVKFKPISGKEDQAGGSRLAIEGREQLLHRARQCARRQRHDLRHHARQAN